MALLYVTDRKRSLTGWLGLSAAALLVGSLLGAGLLAWARNDDDATAEAPSQSDCCTGKARLAPSSSGLSELAVHSRTPVSHHPAVHPADEALRVDAMVRRAELYADCQALAETPQDPPADVGAAPREQGPGHGADSLIERALRSREQVCRGIGPYEYRQTDALLREASQRGHRGAQFLLLRGRVSAHVRAAALAAPESERASDATRGMVADVEDLARQGHREAMVLAAQLLVAQPLGLNDAVRAAAWNVLALELERGRSLSDEDLASTGVVESLTADEALRALREAKALRALCCRTGPS